MKAHWAVSTGRNLWAGLCWIARLPGWLLDYVRSREPTIYSVFWPLLLVALVLFIRDPRTNYIFDEQEALLANPYVNAVEGLTYWDVVHRDFWGLPPNGSIGSYRPIPNMLWRAIWQIHDHQAFRSPFLHHLYNIAIHALNGAILARFAYLVTRRKRLGWAAGAIFVCSAVLTEAVSGIVGIADVFGGLGAVLALLALSLPAHRMVLAVFAALTFGLFSKESALVVVPLLPVVMLVTAPALHPQRPARVMRALLVACATIAAFVLYVELRKAWFPSPLPAKLKEPLPLDASQAKRMYRELLVWFHQAPLPHDPLNNPLVKASFPERVSGALRVFWRGFTQVLFPKTLSGDYSYPQEPIPTDLYTWESIAGGLLMALPIVIAPPLTIWKWLRERRTRGALSRRARGPEWLTARDHRSMTGYRSEAPIPKHARTRQAGIVGMAAGCAGLAMDRWMIAQGHPVWVLTWPLAAGTIVVGLALLVRGWGPVATPVVPKGPWPIGQVALMLVPVGLVWMVVSYFPHSNIPVVLPTVRAERFWYFPVIGTSLVLAVFFEWFRERHSRKTVGPWTLPTFLFGSFLLVQAARAYGHSMDYESDLVFWEATKNAVPRSAKAHLNFAVMKGARRDYETRLSESLVAMELAPEWPMAHVYTGDVLCRMDRLSEAWPHYAKGFDLGPNDRSLIALALQCLWDKGKVPDHAKELEAMAEKHKGSWLAYLAIDIVDNGKKHNGVDPQYRPRGYNEGAKKD